MCKEETLTATRTEYLRVEKLYKENPTPLMREQLEVAFTAFDAAQDAMPASYFKPSICINKF